MEEGAFSAQKPSISTGSNFLWHQSHQIDIVKETSATPVFTARWYEVEFFPKVIRTCQQ